MVSECYWLTTGWLFKKCLATSINLGLLRMLNMLTIKNMLAKQIIKALNTLDSLSLQQSLLE